MSKGFEETLQDLWMANVLKSLIIMEIQNKPQLDTYSLDGENERDW